MSGDNDTLVEINTFVMSLAGLAASGPFEERVLLAPSRRIGIQWLDSVARSGTPVLNFRVNTLRGLAVQLASPAMASAGVTLAGRLARQVCVARAFAAVERAPGETYLGGLAPGPGLTETLDRTIRDLRMAGLDTGALQPADFEVPAKGRELQALLSEYERQLAGHALMDMAGAFRLAVERLTAGGEPPGGTFFMRSVEESRLAGLELALWNAIPARVVIEADGPAVVAPAGSGDADARLLSFVNRPADAPAPAADGSVEIFRAAGEANEVREIIRRVAERRIPFDQVEIIHTDQATYVPLIYEVCCGLSRGGASSAPVTFYEGLPSIYSRPARALAAWVSWVREGLPQGVLAEMLADGLIEVAGGAGLSRSRLSAITRAVQVGAGFNRYLPTMDAQLVGLRRQLKEEFDMPGEDQDEEPGAESADRRREALLLRISGLEVVRRAAASLLETVPGERSTAADSLALAARFLRERAASRGEFDNYCREKLLEDIEAVHGLLASEELPGFDALTWLAGLTRDTMLKGEGPRPGCLFVSGIAEGGHSGRPHTFIVGLDDARFPGGGAQDPLLLDAERSRISDQLTTGAARLSRRLHDIAVMFAGLRGKVTLSYPCRDLVDDRELFASPALLSVFRLVGRRDGDHEDLARMAGDPASFAPSEPGRALDETEWWLAKCCGSAGPQAWEAAGSRFPNLARGMRAAQARAGDRFTEYDGWVPEAGQECDPTSPDGPVMSASRLQLLADCPLVYFFKYVLRIEPPEEYELDPDNWLDRAQMGELLHSVFRRFMSELASASLRPLFERDLPLMNRVLTEEADRWRYVLPPPSELLYRKALAELTTAARIFLREEQDHCESRLPSYFEMSVGLEPEGEGCPLDCPEPVSVTVSGEASIRVRGRIDRIDRLEGEGHTYEIWDYKTGSAYGYSKADPFNQGRHVQGALYLALAQARLAEAFPGAEAVRFGYFFPGIREYGERIDWTGSELAGCSPLLLSLCELARTGCFPFTETKEGDIRYRDYAAAYGDKEKAVVDIRRKLAAPGNDMLRPFRMLRGVQPTGGEAAT